jgi:hypothetical protein
MHNFHSLYRSHDNEIRLHGEYDVFNTTSLRIRAVMSAVCYNFMHVKFQELCSEGHRHNTVQEFRDLDLSTAAP